MSFYLLYHQALIIDELNNIHKDDKILELIEHYQILNHFKQKLTFVKNFCKLNGIKDKILSDIKDKLNSEPKEIEVFDVDKLSFKRTTNQIHANQITCNYKSISLIIPFNRFKFMRMKADFDSIFKTILAYYTIFPFKMKKLWFSKDFINVDSNYKNSIEAFATPFDSQLMLKHQPYCTILDTDIEFGGITDFFSTHFPFSDKNKIIIEPPECLIEQTLKYIIKIKNKSIKIILILPDNYQSDIQPVEMTKRKLFRAGEMKEFNIFHF